MWPFTKHDWELIDKQVFPAPYEILRDEEKSLLHSRPVGDGMFARKAIYTFRCKLTGKIKQKLGV